MRPKVCSNPRPLIDANQKTLAMRRSRANQRVKGPKSAGFRPITAGVQLMSELREAPQHAPVAFCPNAKSGSDCAHCEARHLSVCAALEPDELSTLDRLARIAGRCPDARLEVSGFTDNQGDADFNKQLSKSRADAVVAALGRRGVAASRMSSVGHGADQPVAANDTDAGRAKNRRIEIHVR